MSWTSIANNTKGTSANTEYDWYGLMMMKLPAGSKETYKIMTDIPTKDKFKEKTGWETPIRVFFHDLKRPNNKYAEKHVCTRFNNFCPYCYINAISNDAQYKTSVRYIVPVVRSSDGRCGYFMFNSKMVEQLQLVENHAYSGNIIMSCQKTNAFPSYSIIATSDIATSIKKEDIERWQISNFHEALRKASLTSQKFFGSKINGYTVSGWMRHAQTSGTIDVSGWGGLMEGLETDDDLNIPSNDGQIVSQNQLVNDVKSQKAKMAEDVLPPPPPDFDEDEVPF